MQYQNGANVFDTPRGAIIERAYTKGANKGKLYLRIEWNPNFGPKATRTFRTAQAAFTNECIRLMDRYVPFDTGVLKNSVGLATNYEAGRVVYPAPYAQAQYYLHPQGVGIHDGRRGSYWGQRMAADNKAHLHKFAAGEVGRGMRR